jgi:hypothetical protein
VVIRCFIGFIGFIGLIGLIGLIVLIVWNLLFGWVLEDARCPGV